MDETGTHERKQVCFSTYMWPMSENTDVDRTFSGGTDRQRLTDKQTESIAYILLAHAQCGVMKDVHVTPLKIGIHKKKL